MTRTKTSRMLHHDRGELSVCRSGTFRKSSRGIEAICDCLLGRQRTEIGIGHDDGRSVATMVQRNDFLVMEGTGWRYARSTQLQFAAVPNQPGVRINLPHVYDEMGACQ
jgi:hypothetical protein